MMKHPWYKTQIANCLTILRLILIPIFIFAFSYHKYLLAFILFATASLTDFLDGILARKYNVTNFGKFTDAFADKLLIAAALIVLATKNDGFIPIWMVVIIIIREVIVTTLRSIFVAKHGKVVSANIWGKAKALSQMVVISVALALLAIDLYITIDAYIGIIPLHNSYGVIFIMMCIPLTLTVVSGFQFLHSNRKALLGLLNPKYQTEK